MIRDVRKAIAIEDSLSGFNKVTRMREAQIVNPRGVVRGHSSESVFDRAYRRAPERLRKPSDTAAISSRRDA